MMCKHARMKKRHVVRFAITRVYDIASSMPPNKGALCVIILQSDWFYTIRKMLYCLIFVCVYTTHYHTHTHPHNVISKAQRALFHYISKLLFRSTCVSVIHPNAALVHLSKDICSFGRIALIGLFGFVVLAGRVRIYSICEKCVIVRIMFVVCLEG